MHPFEVLDDIHEQSLLQQATSGSHHASLQWFPPWLKPAPDSRELILSVQQSERTETTRVYTGEPIRTQLAARRILELETARLLLTTRSNEPQILAWIEQTHKRSLRQCFAATGCVIGECSLVAIAFIRYLAACPWDASGQILARQVQGLRHLRDGRGRWSRIPFYYTMLALREGASICPAARDELLYACGACQDAGHRIRVNQPYRGRREALLRAVLASASSLDAGTPPVA